MTDKIRKYVLPNIPYAIAFWFCLKLGTAYRMAEGVKLIGMVKTVTSAFGSIWPGVNSFDSVISLILWIFR